MPTRPDVHVFLGKGGVGKTTCAAATALRSRERRRTRVDHGGGAPLGSACERRLRQVAEALRPVSI